MDWIDETNFYTDYPKLKRDAYEMIASFINQGNSKNILDFGCGDGKQISFISKSKNIYLYDINKAAVKSAIINNPEREITVYDSLTDIPDCKFDSLICSLVLMCVDNKDDYFKIIKTFKRVLKNNSELLLLVTHPAFREKEFSYYKAFFNEPFNYFKEGKPFQVIFKNINEIIIDYHWSLSFTINSLLKTGFSLVEFIEMEDSNLNNEFVNENYSPYLLLKFKS